MVIEPPAEMREKKKKKRRKENEDKGRGTFLRRNG